MLEHFRRRNVDEILFQILFQRGVQLCRQRGESAWTSRAEPPYTSCMSVLPFQCRFLAAMGMLASSCLPMANAAGPSPLDARTWDQAMVIPEGRYRAARPIDLVGEIDAVVQPGAFLDGIEFISSKRQPHWKIDGAFLRDVKISGDLGTSLEAKNSVFEKCFFGKSGAWFVSMWSTRWRFENCVFAKIFMTDTRLSVVNHSVAARDCTFVGVRFPGYELKGDGKYLRGPELVLERCRFVRCHLPQIFLAITKDCVFENCTFSTTGADWPRETIPQKVTAYYAEGQASPPKSYANRPFEVSFEPAPPDFKAGSTLDFEENGGTVALRNLPPPAAFIQIGTLASRKASEMK